MRLLLFGHYLKGHIPSGRLNRSPLLPQIVVTCAYQSLADVFPKYPVASAESENRVRWGESERELKASLCPPGVQGQNTSLDAGRENHPNIRTLGEAMAGVDQKAPKSHGPKVELYNMMV